QTTLAAIGTSALIDQQIVEELQSRRVLIKQLETQLKQRHVGSAAAASQNVSSEFLSGSGAATPAAQSQASGENKPAKAEPFAFADFTWLNGNPRTKTPAFNSKFFTPEIRADVDYIYDFRHPKDDTVTGSIEGFRD